MPNFFLLPPCKTKNEILDADTFLKIQNLVSKAIPVGISTFDLQLCQICPSSNTNPLCKDFLKMRDNHPEVADKCAQEHLLRLKEALETGKSVNYRCWLGFENTTLPVKVNGKPIGAVLAGHVLTEAPKPETFEVLRQYGLNPQKYFEMAANFDRTPQEKYNLWMELLSTVINSTAKERYGQIGEITRTRRLEFVSELARNVGENLDGLLGFIVQAMPEACRLERCTVMLRDEHHNRFMPRISNVYTGARLAGFSIPFEHEYNLSEPFISSDSRHDSRLTQKEIEKFGIKSVLALPLKVKDKILGAVVFENHEAMRQFTQEEIHFINLLTSEVAIAMESALLQEDRKAKEEELNRFRQEVQNYFTQIGKAVSSALNISSLLHLIADFSMKVVKADGCAVYLHEERGLKQQVSLGEVPESHEAFQRHLQKCTSDPGSKMEIFNLEDGTGTFLCVPLKTREEIYGCLYLFLKEGRNFSKEELDVTSAFVTQAAISMRNVRLFQAEQEKAWEMGMVYEAAKAISAPQDLNQILSETAERMCGLAGVNRSLIFLLDSERKVLSVSTVHGVNPDQKDFFSALAIPQSFLEGSLWPHFKQGRPKIIRPAELQHNDPLKNLFVLFSTKTCLLAPLLTERRLTGLIYLDRPDGPHTFTESQVRSIMSLSIYAATSIERAQLFKQLENRVKQIHTLYQISTALSTSLYLDRILSLIVEKTSQLVKTERLCLFMWSEERNAFMVTASHGLSEEFISKAVVKIEDRFVGLASYRKKPIYSANVLLETDNTELVRLFKKEGLGAVLAVPLVTKRKTIGVITLFAELGFQFREEEIDLLGNFAGHAALSIENAKIYSMNKQKLQELGILFDVGKRISTYIDPQDVLRTTAEQFLWVLQADGCSIMLLDKNGKNLTIQVVRGITRKSNMQKRIRVGEGIVGEVARTGQPEVIHDDGKENGSMRFPKTLREEGIQTILCVPLAAKEGIIGVANLYTKERREFTFSEMHLMTTLGGQAAVALRNAQIFEEHYHVAQLLQRSLLPAQIPTLKELEIGFQYLPSEEISGDYYDFLEMPGKLGITVADVAGKGTAAAIFTAQGKYGWKAYGLLEPDPRKVLMLLNKLIVQSTPQEKFISMFYGVLDYTKKEMVYANAGHLPPLLYKAKAKQCQVLSGQGLLLGVEESVDFQKRRVSLQANDVLLFYTDGVTEARNTEGEIFGMARLEKLFSENAGHSPQVIANRILTSLRQFTHKRALDDDITIVAVKLK